MTDQEKREKVISGLRAVKETLEDMRDGLGAKWCEDAITMLKAQEPVEPIPTTDDDWTCGNCGMSLVGYEELDAGGFTTVRHNFCPNCGKKVKWG